MQTTVYGVVTAHNQEAPGPASAVRLRIAARFEEGPVVLENCRPSNALPPDTLDVDAGQLLNTWVHGYRHDDGRIRWIAYLFPDQLYCEGT